MRSRALGLFYVALIVMGALSFLTSTALGFVIVCLGVMIRLLEIAVVLLRDLLNETRQTRLELRAARLTPRDEPRN